MNKQDYLRALPKVDDLLADKNIQELVDFVPRPLVVEAIRSTINQLRQDILSSDKNLEAYDLSCERMVQQSIAKAKALNHMHLRPVINATGVVLHTNLGRALLPECIKDEVWNIASQYSTLEFDLTTGGRGKRYDHIDTLIKKLTGAEDVLVVNNNAAAVMLVLSTVAKGKEVITSRGELVEIGGAFRVPDVMAESGAILKEVGTTNKTHLSDYENAIEENLTGALLKVHTSNYKILGFTEDVALSDMVKLGNAKKIPVIHDLGCGLLYNLAAHGIGDESLVTDSVKAGSDIICFSGDKLLGGPQAGIIIGKKVWIDKMKKNPLTRAFRIDKLTLAALEATLRLYIDPEIAKKEIPVLKRILMTENKLQERAEHLANKFIEINHLTVTIERGKGQIGGGSMPTVELDSVLIGIVHQNMSVNLFEQKLRELDKPIIARIFNDKVYFDVRTIEDGDFDYITKVLTELSNV